MTVRARILIGLVVIALVLGGLGAGVWALLGNGGDQAGEFSGPAPTPSAEPGARDAPDPALRKFYEQELRWERCRDKFECAELTVPIDYREPEGATIEIALLKDPADRPERRIASLVVNPGGPGVPGTSYAAASGFVFADVLRQRFDIVGFDPRGTGSSAPVDCVSDRELDALVAVDPTPDQPAEVQEAARTSDDFFTGCVDGSGELAEHVTTIETARDMDILRAALGEESLDYFGASYGTKLGATYAELFPERVGRFVLDGAVDVSLDAREASLKQAAGFETALRSYVENCVEETDGCFLGDSVEEGLQRIRDLLEQVDQRPLPAGERQLRVGNAFYGLVFPLYNRDYWFLLSEALQAAFDGNGAPLLRLADLYFSRRSDGTYADNSGEAILAINCLDDPYAITPEEVPAQIPEFKEASPTFGEVFAWGLVGCRGIKVRSSEQPLDLRAEGAEPILVIGTTRDPATPYEGAVALAEQLESGVLLTRDGDGHTGYNQGNECVDNAVHAYLVEGEVPEDGAEC